MATTVDGHAITGAAGGPVKALEAKIQSAQCVLA